MEDEQKSHNVDFPTESVAPPCFIFNARTWSMTAKF